MANISNLTQLIQDQKFLPLLEKADLIIEKLLEKYGLADEQERCIRLYLESTVPEEKRKLLEEAPRAKISRIVKKYLEEKILAESLAQTVKENLNLDSKKAESLAEDLKKGVEVLKKEVMEEIVRKRMEIQSSEKISLEKPGAPLKIFLEKPIAPPSPRLQRASPPKEKKEMPPEPAAPPQKDVYREMPSEEEYQPRF